MPETISCPFTFVKDGVFYFSRRIPTSLKQHYSSPRIAYSLRTRSAKVAESRARRAADKLDEYWYHLRSIDAALPGQHMLREKVATAAHLPAQANRGADLPSVRLSEAVAVYLELKGKGRPKTFRRAAERSCGYVIDVCGDKDLTEYTKADATTFRDALIARGLAGTSMTRVFGTVRAVTNFGASEHGITLNNPFTGVYYDRKAGASDRSSIPGEALAEVQRQCGKRDDDLRWMVALVSDTGLRLAEAAGLLKEDIVVGQGGQMHVLVRPHAWRRLKTKGSEREVPLEGKARWAASRLLASADGSHFAFPRYNKTDVTNANAASAALNKWLKSYVPAGCNLVAEAVASDASRPARIG